MLNSEMRLSASPLILSSGWVNEEKKPPSPYSISFEVPALSARGLVTTLSSSIKNSLLEKNFLEF